MNVFVCQKGYRKRSTKKECSTRGFKDNQRSVLVFDKERGGNLKGRKEIRKQKGGFRLLYTYDQEIPRKSSSTQARVTTPSCSRTSPWSYKVQIFPGSGLDKPQWLDRNSVSEEREKGEKLVSESKPWVGLIVQQIVLRLGDETLGGPPSSEKAPTLAVWLYVWQKWDLNGILMWDRRP